MTNANAQAARLKKAPNSLLGQLSRIITKYADREGTEFNCAIRDTLTDIRHLCDIHGLEWAALDEQAYDVYREELGAAL
jgi:hypothetical protein